VAVPAKRYLETGVARGEIVKVHLEPGRVKYHLPADKKGRR
jgi:hypothetical protein